ncbi:reverse transcriptase domain-containing protein [Tanacetum coccineum]
MRTRSQSRNLHHQQQQAPPPVVEPFNLEEPIENPAPPLASWMIPGLWLTLAPSTTEGFIGIDKEDPHAHIRYFNKITSTMRFPDVPSTSIKLMLFPFSLEGSARIWLEKEPPRSILTWDDLVSKFINQFFPPSKMTNLRNEITRFQQRFDESFYEAWDRFNDLLRACPHHGFSELHQLDTFYNALNANDQDSLNSAAGGNFLDKMPRECLRIIESATSGNVYRDNIQEYVSQAAAANFNQGNTGYRAPISNQIRPPGFTPVQNNIMLQNKETIRIVSTKTEGDFNSSCLTNPRLIKVKSIDLRLFNLLLIKLPPIKLRSSKSRCIGQEDVPSLRKANDAVMRNMQSQGQNMQSQLTNLTDMLSKFVTSNTASTLGTLPSNTVTNPKEDLKGITTRSGVAYKGPTIPITSSPKVVERETEVTKDTMPPANNGSTEDVQPPVVLVVHS